MTANAGAFGRRRHGRDADPEAAPFAALLTAAEALHRCSRCNLLAVDQEVLCDKQLRSFFLFKSSAIICVRSMLALHAI
jgi:hypothetical protein